MPGRPGCGHGDRPVPPGFAGVSVWRPAFVACAFSAGSGDCSICGPGNNDGRSRRPDGSRPPGKTVGAVALHGSPWRRFRRAGTPRQSMASGILSTEDGRCGSSARCKKLDRQRTVGVFPYRLRRRPARASASLGADDGSIPHCRRSSQCRSVDGALSVRWRMTPDGCLHGIVGAVVGATDSSRGCPSCPVNRITPDARWPVDPLKRMN